jgi:hypothetical protein
VRALYHVVLFALRDEEKEQLDSLLGELRELARLPMVRSLACGSNNAPSAYDGALVVELAGSEELEAYRAHPDHAPVAARLRAMSRTLDVADFSV